MNISAKDLIKKNGLSIIINEELKSQFKILSEKIIDENKNGNTKLLYNLPTIYPNIPYDVDKCSIYICKRIINELKSKNFNVTVKKINHKIILMISWTLDIE